MNTFAEKFNNMQKLLDERDNMSSREVSVVRTNEIDVLLRNKKLDDEEREELKKESATLMGFIQNETATQNTARTPQYTIYDLESVTPRQLLALIDRKIIISGIKKNSHGTFVIERMLVVKEVKRDFSEEGNVTIWFYSHDASAPSVTLTLTELSTHIIEVHY